MTIEIFVEGEGLADVETIHVEEGGSCRDIIEAVARKGGFPAAEGLLFVEDCEEPLDIVGLVPRENAGKIHHVHRARQIEVAVHYQGRHIEMRFAPSTRVQRVLDWAVGPRGFKIDPAIAPEMELALHGTTKPLPKEAHIGRFLRHPAHKLAFDLIRGVVPNGASL